MDSKQLRDAALYYHRHPRPGKIAVTPIKQLTNQYDLSMAYSPGVAAARLPVAGGSPFYGACRAVWAAGHAYCAGMGA